MHTEGHACQKHLVLKLHFDLSIITTMFPSNYV